MTRALGHKVKSLVRVAIGGYELGDLAPGQCRILNPAEIRSVVAAQ